MKESSTFRIIIQICSFTAVFAAILLFILASGGSQFTDSTLNTVFVEFPDREELEVSSEADDVLSVEGFDLRDNKLTLELKAHKKGKVAVVIRNKSTGEDLVYEEYRVGLFHTIFNENNGNFNHYRQFVFAVTLYLIVLAVQMWRLYTGFFAVDRYSYRIIFLLGYALWISLIALLAVIDLLMGYGVKIMISNLQSAGMAFMNITLPAVLIFAVALSVSNVSLIRHEGLKRNNLLGIMISILMIAGEAVAILINYSFSGSELQYHLNNIFVSTYTSVYVLFECFLIGAIVNGVRAAVYEPPLDRDYIIIDQDA